MKPIYWISLSAVFFSVFPAAAAGKDSFQPNVVKVVPAVSDHFEIVLLLAGKPENRYQRSRQLKETLPKIEDINPLEQTRELMGWLAVMG